MKLPRVAYQPMVCCVCLTKDRPDMLRRAIASFKEQTYASKRLLIVNSGSGPEIDETDDIWEPCFVFADALTIGALRNLGNSVESWTQPDIICHWDDDDVSHPNRIAEQVAQLQLSGADVAGYSDCVFWDTRDGTAYLYRAGKPNYAVGTSLMYWRRTWEQKPFPDISDGEDTIWQQNMRVSAISSIDGEPRIIATIHGSNSNQARYDALMRAPHVEQVTSQFRRAPEFDEYCRERMKCS